MTPAEKAARFRAELKPNPSYDYEPPMDVVIDGVRCIEIDAGVLTWARDIAHMGASKKLRTTR